MNNIVNIYITVIRITTDWYNLSALHHIVHFCTITHFELKVWIFKILFYINYYHLYGFKLLTDYGIDSWIQ